MEGLVGQVHTQGMTDALQIVVASLNTPEMERARLRLMADVLDGIDLSVLMPSTEMIGALLRESVAKIAADAVAGIDLAALGPVIEAATRDIVDRAAVIEAVENSGYRTVLYKIADEHHGYVTTALARTAGVPSVEVRKIASRGGMTNIARGLYRVDGVDGGERASYAEAVLRVGDGAHLIGDSVLAFHDLALVNPRHITVGTPRRVRRVLPAHIRLTQSNVNPAHLTEYDGVASVTVERAITDSIGAVMPDRLLEATQRAADNGLLRRSSVKALLEQIGSAT